ncbi:MAG: hypothetical protein ACK4JD_12595 [Thermoflexales bacterium]
MVAAIVVLAFIAALVYAHIAGKCDNALRLIFLLAFAALVTVYALYSP